MPFYIRTYITRITLDGFVVYCLLSESVERYRKCIFFRSFSVQLLLSALWHGAYDYVVTYDRVNLHVHTTYA